MSVNRILKGEDLMEIATFLMEKKFDSNIIVEIEVEDEDTLKRINEDYFYRYSNKDRENITTDEIEDICINIAGVRFKYVLKNKEN